MSSAGTVACTIYFASATTDTHSKLNTLPIHLISRRNLSRAVDPGIKKFRSVVTRLSPLAGPPSRKKFAEAVGIYQADISKCRAVYQVFPAESLSFGHTQARSRPWERTGARVHRIVDVIKFT